jgi:hypothetical protein
MRQVTRMALIPEELYSALMNSKNAEGVSTKSKKISSPKAEVMSVTSNLPPSQLVPNASKKIVYRRSSHVTKQTKKKREQRRKASLKRSSARLNEGVGDGGGDALIEIENRLAAAAKNATLGDDAKEINVQQEFQRLQKLRRARDERPVLVKVRAAGDGGGGGSAPITNVPLLGETAVAGSKRTGIFEPNSPPKRLALSRDEERTVEEILDYIDANKQRLGVSPNGGILQLTKQHPSDVVKGSNVRLCVEWEIYGGYKSSQLKRPPGHASFLRNISGDAYMMGKLPPQRGEGGRKFRKRVKFKSNRTNRRFMPVLW